METLSALKVSFSLIELGLTNDPANFDITNMKLQKLLYYVQGTSLAIKGKRMFDEEIKKWQYGPVVPEVYHFYKDNGNQILLGINTGDINKRVNSENLEVIKSVYDYFGQFSAIQLMNLTHNESPWNSVEMKETITDELLLNYFNMIVIKE